MVVSNVLAQTKQEKLQQVSCPACSEEEVDLPKGTPEERKQVKEFIYNSSNFEEAKGEIQSNSGEILER